LQYAAAIVVGRFDSHRADRRHQMIATTTSLLTRLALVRISSMVVDGGWRHAVEDCQNVGRGVVGRLAGGSGSLEQVSQREGWGCSGEEGKVELRKDDGKRSLGGLGPRRRRGWEEYG
jgi:hypothetical protein